MSPFNQSVILELLEDYPLSSLDAGKPRDAVHFKLKALTIESLFEPREVKDRSMGACCISALWLWHNYLDESHKISQEIETSAGSAWHGLMHRREGDFWNANYWFARVRDPSLFAGLENHFPADELAALSPSLRSLVQEAPWNPTRFTDEVEKILARKIDSEVAKAVLVSSAEWRALFENCWNAAVQ